MDAQPFLEALVHREIAHQYMGHRLRFGLSRELFSSAGVDPGTALLLRALQNRIPRALPNGILDLGCGTGTLGLSLAAAAGAALHATDRDALACWFTARNARVNGISACAASIALGVHAPFTARNVPRADLAVSNLPAKAGAPVLAEMVRTLAARGDVAAVVIVQPLRQFLEHELEKSRAEIIDRRTTSQHLAVVYRHPDGTASGVSNGAPGEDEEPLLPSCYIRGRHHFAGPSGDYELTAVHNLPEFDSLSYGSQLAFRIIKRTRPGGAMLFWGVGQGHIPVAVAGRKGSHPLYIADRDLLAVATTATNLEASGRDTPATPLVVPTLSLCAETVPAGSLRWMVVQSAPSSASLWEEELLVTADALLSSGGHLMIVSRSTALARLERACRQRFSPVDSVRSRGYRVDLLVRKR